jgi:O-antigen/teichoic acid export membrane protein
LRDDFEGIDVLFKIMAIIPFFVALGGIFGQLGLLALGDERDKMNFQRVYLIAGTVALVSVFVSIPHFGAKGAAVSLLITEVLVCVLMVWFGRKVFKIK